jgi:hypothetical protein
MSLEGRIFLVKFKSLPCSWGRVGSGANKTEHFGDDLTDAKESFKK